MANWTAANDSRADCPEHYLAYTEARFYLVAVFGTAVAGVGLGQNALLFYLFLTRRKFRRSAIFFLAFVALFDCLLDAAYVGCLSVIVYCEHLGDMALYYAWNHYIRPAFVVGQISKTASTFCLIATSFERYCTTGHWTFVGFKSRSRCAILAVAVGGSFVTKASYYWNLQVIYSPHCQGFSRYRTRMRNTGDVLEKWLESFFAVFLPFVCLVMLNGGIVIKLRQQTVVQMRTFMLQLAVGKRQVQHQKKRIRDATRTLFVVVCVYLLSNLLNLVLIVWESTNVGSLVQFTAFYRLSSDVASLMAVVANVLRLPIYAAFDPAIRHQLLLLLRLATSRRAPRTAASTVPTPAWSTSSVGDLQQSGLSRLRRFSDAIGHRLTLDGQPRGSETIGWGANLLLRASQPQLTASSHLIGQSKSISQSTFTSDERTGSLDGSKELITEWPNGAVGMDNVSFGSDVTIYV